MDITQMRYFLAVCETRHFTRAARLCGVSQPSLSNGIRRLEQQLGGRLLERGRPVRPSALGEAVLPHFTAILREVDTVHRLLAAPGERAPADAVPLSNFGT